VAKYRVHFTWKEKEYQLIARSLDLTHPYFVSIKDLLFPKGKNLIIDPSEDDVRKTFSETNHVMIPLQSVSMIEELADDDSSKVMPFGVVDEEEPNSDKV
jgi:hypothetical protein